jgi:hypothetical protein
MAEQGEASTESTGRSPAQGPRWRGRPLPCSSSRWIVSTDARYGRCGHPGLRGGGESGSQPKAIQQGNGPPLCARLTGRDGGNGCAEWLASSPPHQHEPGDANLHPPGSHRRDDSGAIHRSLSTTLSPLLVIFQSLNVYMLAKSEIVIHQFDQN